MEFPEARREIRFEHDSPETTQQGDEMSKTNSKINVGDGERLVSGLFGGLLALHGLKNRGFGGYLLAALGGSMIYRGFSGQCSLYKALGINTAEEDGKGVQQGILFEKSVVIDKPSDFWRNAKIQK